MPDGERMQALYAEEWAEPGDFLHAGRIAAAVAEKENEETEHKRGNGPVAGRKERPGDCGRTACDNRLHKKLEEAERNSQQMAERRRRQCSATE